MNLKKFTNKICHKNKLESIPPATFLKILNNNNELSLMLVTYDLIVYSLNLKTLEFVEVSDLSKLLKEFNSNKK